MSDARPVLVVRGLSLAIAGRRLCETFDWTVRAGESWAIVGPNGAGKTTLLRALAGLTAPAAGEIHYGDAALATLGLRERALWRGLLPQDSTDAFPASVLETVLVGRHPHLARLAWEGERDFALAHAALAVFGIDTLAERDVHTLSGGERRRVALAALWTQDPPLLLLDEPSSHLDIAQQAAALDVLAALARERGKALVMVLHDLHLATRHCDHALLLGDGRAETGPATELLRADKLSALFGRSLRELRDGDLRAFVPE